MIIDQCKNMQKWIYKYDVPIIKLVWNHELIEEWNLIVWMIFSQFNNLISSACPLKIWQKVSL